jgi:hypothetical protein
MHDHALRDTLSRLASDAVPDTTDLWPGISRRVADRPQRARIRLDPRRMGLLAAAALVVVVGWTLAQPSLTGRLSTAQAADIARQDPEVAAILRGDIAIVTVTSVVDDTATVVVQDSHGQQVAVSVNLVSRIVTRVYQGPQLSAGLTERALAVVRKDPRTSALLGSGATFGQITPILVSYESTDPTTGSPTQGTETWAQVPLELDGKEWVARVNLPLDTIDQLLDPQGAEVPLP